MHIYLYQVSHAALLPERKRIASPPDKGPHPLEPPLSLETDVPGNIFGIV